MTFARALSHASTASSLSSLRHSLVHNKNLASAFHTSAWRNKSCVVEWGYGSTERNVFESDSVIPKVCGYVCTGLPFFFCPGAITVDI